MAALLTVACAFAAVALGLLGALYRLAAILDPKRSKPLRHGRRNSREPTHLLVVLGSGGHTAEMISMLNRATSEPSQKGLNWRDFTYRTWVVGSGDSISGSRARAFEEQVQEQRDRDDGSPISRRSQDPSTTTYDIATVPRAREIHQPLSTTPLSALRCMRECLRLLTAHADPRGTDFPDIILCNGPATATILVFASILLRFFNVGGCSSRGKMRTVYVESWARVNKLSLSGRLLCRVVDRFLVQWPQLEANARTGRGRAEFAGVLV